MSKQRYRREIPGQMYRYFLNYGEGGVPSFSKFATVLGVSLATLESWRRHKKFAAAWQECRSIRRDRLIDGGLMRRIDPSLTKYILSEEPEREPEDVSNMTVTVEVVGDERV